VVKAKTICAEEIDRIFDEGGDTTSFIKTDTIRFPGREDAVRKIDETNIPCESKPCKVYRSQP